MFAYLNGQLIPAADAVVPVEDAGFVLGVTVAEQLRTFGGKLFRLDQHLERLSHSLSIVDVQPPISFAELTEAAHELVRRNFQAVDPADDLALVIFVTPGLLPAMLDSRDTARRPWQPTVCMHSRPLPFRLWADKYDSGEALMVTDVQQVPTSCWPAELKCRSRMHYFLADQQASRLHSGSRALLTDSEGHVLESSTANVLIYRKDEGLLSPPREKILPGVTASVIEELAGELEIPFRFRDLTFAEVVAADEVLLCSTSPCVWPVTSVNRQPIGPGTAGPVAKALLQKWSEMAGFDIREQAIRFSER